MRQSKRQFACWMAIGLLAASLLGCGGESLVPVEGRVALDDKPLPNATVTLSPVRGTGPGPFVGKTSADGRFALGPADKEGAGAVAGEYILMIATVLSDPNANEMTPAPTQKEIVPAAWRNGSERFTVPNGGTKDANFNIKSR
jgi:hypothetical protein